MKKKKKENEHVCGPNCIDIGLAGFHATLLVGPDGLPLRTQSKVEFVPSEPKKP